MKKMITKLLLSLFIFSQFMSCGGYSIHLKSYAEHKVLLQKRDFPEKGWENMVIFEEEPDFEYEELARIIITGNETASMDRLFDKMRKEAGRYRADAILFVDQEEVVRVSVDGFAAFFNIVNAFSEDSCDYEVIDMGGQYYTQKIIGIAIRYVGEE